MEKILNYINGEFCEPYSKTWIDNYNPSTGKVYSVLPDSQKEDVDQAVAAAKAAFPRWSRLSSSDRADWIDKLAHAISEEADTLARAESVDQGKAYLLAKRLDMFRAVENFRVFAREVRQYTQEYFHQGALKSYVEYEPVGVAALISPWNLPLYLLSWKIAPAIATGNTCVAKPSEITPMTAYLMCKILQKINFPKGVINIVHGYGHKAGAAMTEHNDVSLISFTGGTKTGKSVLLAAAEGFKKVSLELGGKNPTLVFADCEMDKAVDGVIRSAFLNQGEICLCGSRIYVEQKIYNEFRDKLVAKVKDLKVGDPSVESTFMGPVASKQHFEKIMGMLAQAKKDGGKFLTGSEPPKVLQQEAFREGYFISPTIIEGLDEQSTCMQEEIFGPVASIAPFKDLDDAIEKANGVRYGLSASVWTTGMKNLEHTSKRVKAGTIWYNTWLERDLRVPFGGMKQSGMGREGGRSSIDFFTEKKTIVVKQEIP